jgi:hypothetical protein
MRTPELMREHAESDPNLALVPTLGVAIAKGVESRATKGEI